MKQAVMVAPGHIEIRDVPIPEPAAGQVLLRVERIGVCGSDVHVYHGQHPYTSYPVVQGHEFAATVAKVGGGVTGMRVGMKVTATPQISCGACGPCRRGDDHICDNLKVQGFQAPGCAQEFWVTSAEKIVPLPEAFSFEQGALVEPLAVAVRAVSRAGNVAGRRTIVLGAGPIGNLVAQVAQANGAQVLITDLSEYRLEVACQCGIQALSNARNEPFAEAAARAFGGAGFDLAFECVGVEPTLEQAIGNIGKGGTLVIVGVFGERPRADMGLVQDHELNIHGTLMYRRDDYLTAVQLIEDGRVRTEPLVSRHFPLSDYIGAYRLIDNERDRVMKVMIGL